MRTILLFLLLFINFTWLIAQKAKSPIEKLYQEARSQYERGNFVDAAMTYEKLLEKDPVSFLYNYELGLLYFYELNEKKKSIIYLENALRNMTDTLLDIYNYLGQAYQADLQYDKAIEMYQTYSIIPPKPGVIKISMKRYIEKCLEEKEKLEAIAQSRKEVGQNGIQVLNAGRIVNSEFNDFSPLFVDDRKIIISSAREFDYQFGVYVTKPYLVTKGSDGVYNQIDRLINTDYSMLVFDPDWHLLITGFTPDFSKTVYTYEDQIYLRDGSLEVKIEPTKLPKTINFSKQHSAATISTDGLRIIFSVYDIKTKCWNLFMSTRNSDGTWRKAEKIEKISSNKDDNYPMLSPDGYTLYFSSTGHNSMGGYDIFKTTMQENGEWSQPERLPEPINTSANEIWFTISKNGKNAMFSSDRQGGFGQYDIYEVNF